MGSIPKPSWEEVVEAKRAIRDAAVAKYLPKAKGDISPGDAVIPFTSAKTKEITGIDELEELQAKLASGELTAEEVTLAYIERAASVHQATNCLTEVLFDEALKQARALDDYYKAHGKVLGPLHGIPITLKDQFNVTGYDTTLGYVGRSFKPATEDAAVVTIMKNLGAVIVAKTNLPQSIMWNETENPLWGLTVNPRNPAFTTGGSTGGEGALLATHGSFIGWGTDIGGSIRIPAAINGLFGLRPSSGRLPYLGVPVTTDGQEHQPSVIGPLTRTYDALTTITKLIIDAQPWRIDPRCHPIPWREEQYQEVLSRPLVIGLLVDDGVVRVHPPLERALRELESKFRAAGHEVVAWDPSGHQEIIDIMDTYYTVDGGEDVKRDMALGGEPYIPHVEALVNRGKAIAVYEYWQLNRRKLAAQTAYLNKWNATKGPISGREVDVILTANAPHIAVPHRKSRWVGYTKVFSVLDYTCLTFPASKVSAELHPKIPYEPRNDQEVWNQAVYDPESMDGHPVGLQIVGRRLEEEKVLGVAKVIEGLLGR